MTRLTEPLRRQFVRAVMADVPKVDYRAEASRRIDELQAAEFPLGPVAFQNLRDAGWLTQSNYYLEGMAQYIRYSGAERATFPDLSDLTEAKNAQEAKLWNVECEVRALAASCTTLKQLRERAPELAKYLPAPPPPVDRTVPVVQTDVLAVLKAAGWGQ